MYKPLVAARLSALGVEISAGEKQARFNFNTGEQFEIEIFDPGLWRDWVLHGARGLGETFVDCKWDMDSDRLTRST